MQFKLSELIAKFGGQLIGEDVIVSKISPTDLAENGHITFLSDSKFKKALSECKASAIIIKEDDGIDVSIPKIITDNPYFYFSQVSNLFNPRRKLQSGVAKSAYIDHTSVVGDNPSISHNVAIGANVKIGNNCQIFPGVVIGDNVVIGNDITIYPNATIYDNVTIGDECVLHAGSVIGSDGFGNAKDAKLHYHRIPQIGGVVIGTRVEIGANATIDSGTFEPTIIGDGARIDNLVQIAHNVNFGAHSAIAATSGVAGTTKIGKYCMIAGNVGIADHTEICDHTVIAGGSNVVKAVTKPGLYSCGMIVMEYKDWAKAYIHIRNLDKTMDKIKNVQNKLIELEGKINE